MRVASLEHLFEEAEIWDLTRRIGPFENYCSFLTNQPSWVKSWFVGKSERFRLVLDLTD
jgi:hypothetical protein